MFRVFQHHISMATMAELLADSVTSFLAILMTVATMIFFYGSATDPMHMSDAVWAGLGFALVIPLHCGLLGVYREGSEYKTSRAKLGRALLACVLAVPLAYQVIVNTVSEGTQAHQFLGFAGAYLVVGLVVVRGLVFRSWHGAFLQQRILIIGTGREAHSVVSDLKARRMQGHSVVGFYPAGDAAPGIADKRFNVFPESLSINDIIQRHNINQIIVAVKEQRGGSVPMDQLLSARIQGIPVLDLAAFYERTTGEVPVDSLKASWLVYGQGFVQGRARIIIKRLFDILSSSFLLLLASPVMLLTALAIKLESEGPMIYRQERVGLGGKSFMCLKFRSMRVDAEKDGVAVWAKKNDSRVTRVGSFIRKTRIDELPQILSVLKGEMSMVGPRPERPSFVAQLKQQIPYYDIRHSVKPGVTGWAQVRYSYGASLDDALHKHQYDLYYVKNNSLFLDLLILFETVSVVIFREGSQ
ncbi:MAG: TIGR03013 family PEP-CTERM/XrtA system glycosyltransferase [Burkholderiales bacterium]|nr:TIGR03013 family PEP-CTERM/XrtA system glycosyltransferase [Burkholderiales bacterium]